MLHHNNLLAQELADAAMEAETRTRRLPKGTSAYQAAWILDDDFSEEETEEVVLSSPRKTAPSRAQSEAGGGDWQDDEDMEDWQASPSFEHFEFNFEFRCWLLPFLCCQRSSLSVTGSCMVDS